MSEIEKKINEVNNMQKGKKVSVKNFKVSGKLVSNIVRVPIQGRDVGLKDKYLYFFRVELPEGWRQTNATANSLEDLKKRINRYLIHEQIEYNEKRKREYKK